VIQGPKTRRLSFLTFLFNLTLHCICFKIQNQNILFLTEVILVWLENSKKRKKSNKRLKVFRVIKIIRNHFFIQYSEIIPGNKGLYSVSNKTNSKVTALKSDYNFTTYGKFTDTSWIEELQTWKPLSPTWASSSISRKRQATGFGPLHNILSCPFSYYY